MIEYNIDKIWNNKRYMLIITTEDERYNPGDGYSLAYWADHPEDGLLEDVVFVDTAEEFFENYPQHEGLYYQTYDLVTGKRIAYGIVDYTALSDELEE